MRCSLFLQLQLDILIACEPEGTFLLSFTQQQGGIPLLKRISQYPSSFNVLNSCGKGKIFTSPTQHLEVKAHKPDY